MVIVSSFIPRHTAETEGLNYNAGSKKNLRDVDRESVAVLTTGEIEKMYPSVAHAKRRISGILCVINEQCGFKAKPVDGKHSWIQRDLANGFI